MMNLALAVLWAVAAVFLFFYHDRGQAGRLPLPLSALALLMALFNVARWWSVRVLRNQRRGLEAPTYRHRPLRRPSDDRDPDPTFRFTDQPAEPPPPRANGGTGEPGP
jgi:hypothetical protein